MTKLDPHRSELKIIYVVGFARSGTTILGNLLGEIEGFFHLGELCRLWPRIVRSTGDCGCGKPVPECDFWSRVLSATLPVEPEEAGDTLDAPGRYARALRTQKRALSGGTWRHLAASRAGDPEYRRLMERLLHHVAEVSGARVLVDTSKLPKPGTYVRSMSSVTPYFLHLVRDPRGAVLSRQRRSAPTKGGRTVLRAKTTTADSVRWVRRNLEAEALGARTGGRTLRLRYETLVSQPELALNAIARWVGEEPERLPLLDGRTARIGTNHTICGNNNRFRTGEVPLSLDDEWVDALTRRSFLLITALTAPLLLRYRYPIARRDGTPDLSNERRRLGSLQR